LLAPDGGSIANITPASVDFYSSQQFYALEFMDVLSLPNSARPKTVGGLLTASRIKFQVDYPHLGITNRDYLLFGDPDSLHTIQSPNNNEPTLTDLWFM